MHETRRQSPPASELADEVASIVEALGHGSTAAQDARVAILARDEATRHLKGSVHFAEPALWRETSLNLISQATEKIGAKQFQTIIEVAEENLSKK
jgi:hypothetical protein